MVTRWVEVVLFCGWSEKEVGHPELRPWGGWLMARSQSFSAERWTNQWGFVPESTRAQRVRESWLDISVAGKQNWWGNSEESLSTRIPPSTGGLLSLNVLDTKQWNGQTSHNKCIIWPGLVSLVLLEWDEFCLTAWVLPLNQSTWLKQLGEQWMAMEVS